MTQSTTKPPADTLYDRNLRAVIWANQASDGRIRYSVQFTRGYKTEQGNWKESRSFSGPDLLRIAQLAQQAYSRIAELQREAAKPEAA